MNLEAIRGLYEEIEAAVAREGVLSPSEQAEVAAELRRHQGAMLTTLRRSFKETIDQIPRSLDRRRP